MAEILSQLSHANPSSSDLAEILSGQLRNTSLDQYCYSSLYGMRNVVDIMEHE
jgi:hypothetical protein